MARFGRRGRAPRYGGRMHEVFGDSSRHGEWAAVRLRVDGDRIVEADAPGLERDLVGLTLLEAAAVGGETLAVDALANALGPVFRARAVARTRRRGDERRRRQRGRPPALAAERRRRDAAALARPGRPRLRARLLLARERDRRARDVSPARRSARDAGSARGVPPRRRHAVRARLRARRDAEPVHALQRRLPLRRAARLRAARRCRAARDRPLRAHRRARRTPAARARRRPGEGSELHARRARSAGARRASRFPLGEQDKEATRAEAERAGLAAARKPESQEACFLAGDDYRAFLGRHGLEPREGAIVGEDGSELGRHDGFWRFTPGQRRGLGLSAGRAALRPRHAAVRERRRRRAAGVARPHAGQRPAAASTPRPSASRRSSATARRRWPRASSRPPRGFRLELDEPAYGVAAGQAAVLYDGDTVVGYGLITASH